MTGRLTPEKLIFGLKQAADPQLSPDGESVVYVVALTSADTKKQTSSLWLSSRDGSQKRQLTFNGSWVRSPRWSPDGTKLAYVTDRDGKNAIALLRFDGGEGEVLATHGGMVAGLAWSPDGATIAYHTVVNPENPNGEPLKAGEAAPIRVTDRLDYKQDIRGYLAETRAHIFTVSVEGGEPKRWTNDRDDHIAPVWSPDGGTLAVLRPVPNFIPSQLELIDLSTGVKTAVTADMGAVTLWTFTRDGKSLLLNGEESFANEHDFWLQDVVTREKTKLTTDFQPMPSGAAGVPVAPLQPVWLSDTVALFIAATKGRTGLYTIDITTGAVTEETIWNARNTGFSTDASGRYVATVGVNLGSTGEIEIYDRETGKVQQITAHNTELLAAAPPATWERFDIERNGYTIESWLLFPNDFDPAKKYPMVMNIHGGPHSWYGYDFVGLDQALTAAGYIVLYCNPRGSGSYGPDFARQVVTDWGGEDYLDLMAVADEAVKRPYIDAERTGVYGYSYGGFMTSWIVGHNHRFAAAVIGSPVVNLTSFFGTADIGHFWAQREFGGTPWEIREWYLEHSPITHAHKATTPSMIIHYEGDERVPIGQGEELFATLKKVGVDTKFVRLPGGNHLAFRDGEPAYKIAFLEQILDWYARHIGDAAAS